MKRLIQIALVGVLLLAGASMAAAQARPPAPAAGEPQPVVRLGNFLEVGNDVWMHILATTDIRYSTVENTDFERRVRDRASSRNPESTAAQVTESDENGILLRFGAEFRYQIAPESFDTAAEHPIGTGPFQFVSWIRWDETKLVRFENYWETDAEGNNLPYLDAIVGKPKKEDSVRLTARRTGQVQLIDAIAYADVERFQKSSSDKYNLWATHFGGIFVVFNFRRGPFQDKRLRTAAAHAIDRQAIHNAVFYGQGDMLDQPYPRGNFWHLESRSLEYDPDKARALLKQARAVGTPLKIICFVNVAYNLESAQVVQELWNSVGFKVTLEPLDTVPYLNTRKQGDFDGLIGGHTLPL